MYTRNLVFVSACIGILLFGIILITLGSILPSLELRFKETGLNKGLLASILSAGILAGSILFGPVADRYGYKFLFILSTLVSSIAFEGLAFTNSVALLYLSMFFIGAGGGVLNGATNALVADISFKNKGASLSVLGAFFGIGALGMPLLLGILSETFSHSTILAAIGFLMLAPVVYFLSIAFPAPKQAQGFPLRQGIRLLKEPALLLTAFFLFFQSGVESLVNNWTTSLLTKKTGFTEREALMALSFYLVGLTVARLFLGGLLQRVSSYYVLVVSLLLVIFGYGILWFTHSHDRALAGLIITGVGLAAGFPVVLGYIGQLYANISGTAFSIALVIALSGNMLINYIFGQVEANFSIGYLPLMIMGLVFLMVIIVFFIKQKISSRVKL